MEDPKIKLKKKTQIKKFKKGSLTSILPLYNKSNQTLYYARNNQLKINLISVISLSHWCCDYFDKGRGASWLFKAF